MPTYDADWSERLVQEANEVRGSAASRAPMSLMTSLADQLLAATQECERLRKLVGEACDHWEAWMTAEGPGPQPQRDRLSAIRHAAGVEGKGE